MSIEDNTRIVQNIHPLFNERAFDRILSEMVAEDVEWTNVPTGQTFRGHEGMREFMQGWVDAFPDDGHLHDCGGDAPVGEVRAQVVAVNQGGDAFGCCGVVTHLLMSFGFVGVCCPALGPGGTSGGG